MNDAPLIPHVAPSPMRISANFSKHSKISRRLFFSTSTFLIVIKLYPYIFIDLADQRPPGTVSLLVSLLEM